MDEIEVVIRIPEEWIEQFKAFKHPSTLETVILQGTVLPKGHGRLVDADAATKDINAFQDAFAMYTDNMGKYNIVCAAPTVIEADKEVER